MIFKEEILQDVESSNLRKLAWQLTKLSKRKGTSEEYSKELREEIKKIRNIIAERIAALSQEYKEITKEWPNKNWNEERIKKEISEFKERINNFYK